MAAFNIDSFHLDDVEFFSDKRLDNINVYSVVLVSRCVDFDILIADFCQRMSKFSCVQMIQQSSDDFIRFTFVSRVRLDFFSRCLHKVVDNLSFIYKCQINIL